MATLTQHPNTTWWRTANGWTPYTPYNRNCHWRGLLGLSDSDMLNTLKISNKSLVQTTAEFTTRLHLCYSWIKIIH